VIDARIRRLSSLAVLMLVAVGCGVTAPMATPPGAIAPAPTPTSVATAAPAATSSASPDASASAGLDLVVDSGLLEVLPPTVGTVAMEGDPTTAASLVANPDLATSASAVAIARYVGPGDSSGDDLAVVSLVRLRPGIFSEPFFDTWRSDYDGSACEVAGGVVGSETVVTIGAATVHVGACVGGATTYHLHRDDDVLVSIIAIGPGKLGEDVIAGLRP